MEQSKKQNFSSIEDLVATSIDNSSEDTRPVIDLEEDRRPNKQKRLLTTAGTMNQVPATQFTPNDQAAVSYRSIFLAITVLVAFLALGMEFYRQRQNFEFENRQLDDAIEQCRSKIDELREKVTDLKSEKHEFEIRAEYMKKENKELKETNLALTQEVVRLRDDATHSKYQLNLTVADLKMQHQEQLHKQRQEDQSQMNRYAQELAKSHNMEMEDMFQFINCLAEDDTIPVLGIFQRMFRAMVGSSNFDRCMQLLPGGIRHRLTS